MQSIFEALDQAINLSTESVLEVWLLFHQEEDRYDFYLGNPEDLTVGWIPIARFDNGIETSRKGIRVHGKLTWPPVED